MEAHAHADGRRSPAEVYRELIPGHELMNAVTRAERARLGYEVAFVFTSPSILNERHPFFVPLLRAAETRAAYLGIDVVWIAPTLDDWIEETSLARAVAHGARGLAVFGGTHGNVEVLRRRWPALPSVFVESETFGARSAHVAIDNERAFERAVVHLAEGGRTRIATITGRLEGRPAAERLRGYRSALAARGLAADEALVHHGDWTPDSGYDGTRRLLALPERPDAIACASDTQAVGVLVALAEAGVRCPQEIAVTGFDDADYAATMTPALTTVRQPAEEMGVAAVDTLIELIADPHVRPAYVMKSGELIVRESSGARYGTDAVPGGVLPPGAQSPS
jgi:DNA-binding LacI/PurR family transcriptional regulator